jgi:hypothetical protein
VRVTVRREQPETTRLTVHGHLTPDGLRLADQAVSATGDSTLRLAWARWLSDLASRGARARASTRAACGRKHDRAASSNSLLVRRFERLRARHDDLSDRDVYRLLLVELERGKLSLTGTPPRTVAALARRLQRYRQLLR